MLFSCGLDPLGASYLAEPVSEVRPSQSGMPPAEPTKEDLEFRRGAVAVDTKGLAGPTALWREPHRYTSAGMRGRIQGFVELEIVIGTDGAVERARVTRSLDRASGLDDQALKAVSRWIFQPAMDRGMPVPVWMRITLDFKIY
jgi:TonB family protein